MTMLDYCWNRLAMHAELRVQASGTDNIRRLYPHRARLIVRAHRQAVSYLDGALHNLPRLNHNTRLDNKRRRYLERFLDIPAVTRDTLRKLEFRMERMRDELLKPSFNPLSSSRYVVGILRQGSDNNQAFTLPGEMGGKIYLTEHFFDAGLQVYQPIRPRTFDLYGHHMGTVLLHEISHMVLDTLDFAYLDSSRPFVDLIDTGTAAGELRRSSLAELQKNAFSTTTPDNELLKLVDDYDGRWHDLQGEFRRRVLSLTGARDLDGARQTFRTDPNRRTDVILNNADSLALLIAHLGRPVEYQPLE